jgi:hypothetical protein
MFKGIAQGRFMEKVAGFQGKMTNFREKLSFCIKTGFYFRAVFKENQIEP